MGYSDEGPGPAHSLEACKTLGNDAYSKHEQSISGLDTVGGREGVQELWCSHAHAHAHGAALYRETVLDSNESRERKERERGARQ